MLGGVTADGADPNLLESQVAYYRASAAEFDAGVRRTLTQDRTEYARQFRHAMSAAVSYLGEVVAGRDTLEIAAGTGIYTERLAPLAASLTALDASPESVEINKRLAARNHHEIDFVVDDVFRWTPPRRFESIVFTFWLSHVPLHRFDEFWATVDTALAPGGTVGFVDADANHDIETVAGAPDIVAHQPPDEQVLIRKVGSGQEFPIVRIVWSRPSLRGRLAGLGWVVDYADYPNMLIGRARRQWHPQGRSPLRLRTGDPRRPD
jgi:SAM-dependent methyltransferase